MGLLGRENKWEEKSRLERTIEEREENEGERE